MLIQLIYIYIYNLSSFDFGSILKTLILGFHRSNSLIVFQDVFAGFMAIPAEIGDIRRLFNPFECCPSSVDLGEQLSHLSPPIRAYKPLLLLLFVLIFETLILGFVFYINY